MISRPNKVHCLNSHPDISLLKVKSNYEICVIKYYGAQALFTIES